MAGDCWELYPVERYGLDGALKELRPLLQSQWLGGDKVATSTGIEDLRGRTDCFAQICLKKKWMCLSTALLPRTAWKLTLLVQSLR